MPQNALGAPTIANSTAVTETHPLCKNALATQALFEQVWLSTDDDTKKESTESDDDLSEDLGDNNLVDGSHSDIETSNVIFKQTIHATDPNKKPISASTSYTSGNMPQLSPDPQVGNSMDENNNSNNGGESPFLNANYFSLPWI